jgi:S-layer protein (TIGR01567 family)
MIWFWWKACVGFPLRHGISGNMVSKYIIEENTKRIANGFWILGIILLFLVPLTQAVPPGATSYWGNVTIYGTPAPNAIVKVFNSASEEVASTISNDGGNYQLYVPWVDAGSKRNGVIAGETITFLVNGKFANSRITDPVFSINELDLAILSLAATYESVEKRGEVAQGPFLWNTNNFPGFFYDIQSDIGTETLNISYIDGRIIPRGEIIYSTGPEEVSFNHSIFGKYQVIGFMAEKYFAGYSKNTTPANPSLTDNFSNLSTLSHGQLHKVLIDDDTKRTISVNGTIALGEGYVLKAIDIDPNARTMLLSLLKDGTEVDVSPLLAGETYVYSKTVGSIDALPLIMVRLDNIFSGQELQAASLKGLFQLSENPLKIKVGSQIGKMNITSISNDSITMNNSMDIGLEKNTNILLMGNIRLKVADNDSLRYYPYVEYTEPGTYEVRGTVFDQKTQGSMIPSWNARTFAGFYYDLKYDIMTEQMDFLMTPARSIPEGGLQYVTGKVPVDFKVNEKEGLYVSIFSNIEVTQYQLIGWQGEKWIAINNINEKIAKLAFEMGNEDKKTLTTGETWSLGAGYDLTVNDIDVKTPPRQVWFTLRKDGEVIDQAIVQSPVSSSRSDKQRAVYTKKMTILDESDALIFTVYVDTIFQGATSKMVQFKYAWLIDGNSAREIKPADKFGVFEVRMVNPYLSLTNENAINLSKNTELPLFGSLKLKVADSNELRFYPKKDFIIPDQSAPPAYPSVLINNGDANTSSDSVTLGISADNATEMSFSNDNMNWSSWESFSGTKPWKLSSNDGSKTVYFRARNAAGESSIASDTIILATPVRSKIYNVEIRGNVANEPDSPLLKPVWDARSFGAFIYDLKYDRSTETLTITEPLINLNFTRTINKDILWYNTTKIPVDFKVFEREGVRVFGRSSYDIVGWQGEKLVGINGMSNKLARLVLEMGVEDKKTLTVGETWQLGSGYEFKLNAIDAFTTPRQAWFTLSKNGVIIDEGIGQAPTGDTISEKEKAVYIKTMKIQGENNAILFTVYVDKIFSGISSNIVQFKYGWLIDKDSAIELKAGDSFGVFEVRTANSDSVMLSNKDPVSLSKNTETTLMGNMGFKVSDNDALRFYPFVMYTTPGTYEVRGTVYTEQTQGSMIPSWNASTFAGFYYDLTYNRFTEHFNFLMVPARFIPEGGLQYLTSKMGMQFIANEREGVNVSGVTQYQLVGWQGEKWIAVKGKTNKIAKLAFEMGKEDKRTLTIGEHWSLGSGYEMTIDKIDARTSPRQVWFTLMKDGAIIDEGIGESPASGSISDKQKAIYQETRTILNESDSLLFTIYVDNIFSGATSDMVQFKYAWLIDESSSKEIKPADKFGVFEVRMVDPYIMMTNEKPVSLSRNTETTLMGDLKFRVADDSSVLRFYPKVDREIEEVELLPYSLSILINHGEAYARSGNVALSLSATGATEMSFSNDGSSWSPWESYATAKSWTLVEGEGIKTVHFKARNSNGEASPVMDTIFLKTLPSTNLVEIRGTAVNEPQTPDLMPAWDARDFAGFLYDFKYDRSTEILTIGQDLRMLNGSRVIEKDMMRYETTKLPIDFMAFQKEGVQVAGMNTYDVVGWQGEKYLAIRGVANKLSKLVLEMGKEDVKTMTTGENWSLGDGYELIINAIDARITPRQVWFTLKKGEEIIDEGIGQAPMSASVEQKQKAVYFKTMTIQGESDALLFTIYVQNIFSGNTSDIVQFKYAWLIDKDSAKEISAGDTFDVFQVRYASQDSIILMNEIPVNLSRNTVSTILGKIEFKVADSDNLRFYPFVTYTTPGTYEIRGTVANDPNSIPSWDAASFAGLYYDLNSNINTETLSLTEPVMNYFYTRTIPEEKLWYNTTKAPVNFKVFEKEGVLVNGARSYDVTGWQGEKYVAIKGIASKLARLVLEMGKDENKTMITGENWSLGSGYELTVNAIDALSSPRQVWFTLRKDGMIIDEAIAVAPDDNSTTEKQKAVYFKTISMMGESDALLFTVYIDNIYSGQTSDFVRFKYMWLVDKDSLKEIKAGDIYDAFMVQNANALSINLSNDKMVSLPKNTETPIFENIVLKVADSDTLRFYPKVDREIGGTELPPYSLSILINHGEAYARSGNVTLSLSSTGATEMSFSNDGSSWSPWESYAIAKSWTLVEGEGLKTVYFKARNRVGEAAHVTDSITLDTIPPSVNISSPVNGTIMNTPNITIIGNAYDISGIEAGSIIHLFEAGGGGGGWIEHNITSINFSHNITLHEGNNQIIVSYVDVANNSGSASVNLKLSTLKPTVSFEIPIANLSVNTSRTLNLRLNTAPMGLSGYNITISLSNGSVAQITDVGFPEWASLHNNSSIPSNAIWIKAADINKMIEEGAGNIILASLEIRGVAAGITDILINVRGMDNDNGTMIGPDTSVTQINVITIVALPGLSNLPTDPDNDGLYEDINGNGRKDFNDVVLFFNFIEWIAENEPLHNFDFNGNGRIDFYDIIMLFEEL